MSEDKHVRRIFAGASQSVLLAIYYSGDQIIENMMGRERRTHERDERCINNFIRKN
jgi:hypothetical protein